MTYTIIEKKSFPKMKAPKVMPIDNISVDIIEFEELSHIFVATMSQGISAAAEQCEDVINVEIMRMILNSHYKALLNSAFVYRIENNKIIPISYKELDKEFKKFKNKFIDDTFNMEYDEFLIVRNIDGHKLQESYDIEDLYNMSNIEICSIFGISIPIAGDYDLSEFVYNSAEVMACMAFYYDKDETSLNNKGITKLFNRFTKEFTIYEIIDGELLETDLEYFLSIDELAANLYNDTKVILNKVIDEVKTVEYPFFDKLEKNIIKSLNKYNKGTVTITSNEGLSVVFDVEYNNDILEYGEVSKPSLYESFIFKVGLDNILAEGGVMMIRVNTNIFDKDLPICEIYGYVVHTNGVFDNINYKTLRECYSIDPDTGLPIDVETNVIFCDHKGNRTGILID